MAEFKNLSTVEFQEKMKPAALKIYNKIFPGCRVEDLRESGVNVHILDKEFGIDALIYLNGNQWISIQEKYRRNAALKYMDFTQEYMNGVGTKYENPGEWFKLGAQLYFYGWSNKEENAFEKWALLDIVKYKLFVQSVGGLDKIGTLQQNKKHGSASFYAIPINILKRGGCFITDYKQIR